MIHWRWGWGKRVGHSRPPATELRKRLVSCGEEGRARVWSRRETAGDEAEGQEGLVRRGSQVGPARLILTKRQHVLDAIWYSSGPALQFLDVRKNLMTGTR